MKQNTIMKTCLFHNQLRWNPATTYPHTVEKNSAPKKIISLYIMYVTTFYIKINFHFPKKNNFMLATPRTERYEGVLHIKKKNSWWFSRLHIM